MNVNELKKEMDARFDAVDARFDAVDARFATVDARFEAVDRRFEVVDRRFDAVEARIVDEGERTRRHFDVVAESLRSDIRVIAERVVALDKRMAATESERIPIISTLSDHELRLRVLEQHRR